MAQRKPAKKLSRDQVRAWLTTVLSPIVEMLAVERTRTEMRRWSFVCTRANFEFLWPIESMVPPAFRANLRQFLRFFPKMKTMVNRHDLALGDLARACRALFAALNSSGEFATQVDFKWPGIGDEKKYIAEFVVNGWRELPGDRSREMQEFWRKHGEGLIKTFRTQPPFLKLFEAVDNAGDAFSTAVVTLQDVSIGLQDKLADSYELPAVDLDFGE